MQLPPGVLGRDLAGTGLEGPLQPGTLTAVLSSCVFFLKDALGCVQDESLPLPWEEAPDAYGNRGPDGAPGPRGSAGAWGAPRGHPLMGQLSDDTAGWRSLLYSQEAEAQRGSVACLMPHSRER